MGMIYKRGKTYWIKYYRNGKPFFESTRGTKEADAKRLLKKREGEISEGKLPGVYFDRVRFDELAEDFLTDYRIKKNATTGIKWTHLADMDGPTSNESNNNQKALFLKLFFFQKPFKKRV